MTSRRAWKLIGRFGPAALVLVLIAAFFALRLDRHVSLGELRARREALEAAVAAYPALTLAVYLAAYAVLVGASLPVALVLTLTGGFLFGPLVGGLAAALGCTLGACLIFLVCRTAMGDVLRRRAGSRAARLEQGLRQDAFFYLLTLRLVPLVPFWLANLAAGLVAIPLRTFLVATFLGILPASVIYATLGSDLHAVFRRGEPLRPGLFLQPQVLLPLLAIAVLSLAPLVVKRLRRSPRPEGEGQAR
jgi:uncharacterized membrane protein YdjX (TVP38/TMEM64 family)